MSRFQAWFDSTYCDFEGEWRRVSRELTAEQEARRRLEECADLRERDVQSSLGERDAKIKMLEKQLEDRAKRIKILEGRRGR